MQGTEHLTRQLDIIPVEVLNLPITVIGAGAIGSMTVLNLAKMGFSEIKVFDFDEVSVENMNCQFYRFSDIGKSKVEALYDLVKDFTKVEIDYYMHKFIDQTEDLGQIVITAVDSMKVRKAVWELCKDNLKVRWYIDPRMAAEYAVSYVIDPNLTKDIEAYEKTLYLDENAEPERCTAKATMYTASMIGGYVAKHVKDLAVKAPYARVTHWNIGLNSFQNWVRE